MSPDSSKCSRAVTRAAVVLTTIVLSFSVAQAASLYLLSGTTLNGVNLPVRLYSVDSASGGPIALVSEIASGLTCVLPDYEKRLLVVASPAITPTDFSFISMDSPAKMEVRHIPYDTSRMVADAVYLLNVPGRGPGVAVSLNKVTLPAHVDFATSLAFVGPNMSGPPVQLPFEDLRFARVAGQVGGAVTMQQCAAYVRGDPLRVLVNVTPGASFAVPKPPYLKQRGANDSYVLVANDDARSVIVPGQPPEPGVIDVFDKNAGEWRRIPIPFARGRIRAFGHWLAMIEERPSRNAVIPSGTAVRLDKLEAPLESPGAEKRRDEEIGPDVSVDDVFSWLQATGWYFPGELLLCNLVYRFIKIYTN